jgi:hypothetical protein
MSTTIETMPGASTIHKQVKYPDRSFFFSLGDPQAVNVSTNLNRLHFSGQQSLTTAFPTLSSSQVASVVLLPKTWPISIFTVPSTSPTTNGISTIQQPALPAQVGKGVDECPLPETEIVESFVKVHWQECVCQQSFH